MLITKKSKYNKFNKFTKKILKGGDDKTNEIDDIRNNLERNMETKYSFFKARDQFSISQQLLTNCISPDIQNKLEEFQTNSKKPEYKIEIIFNNFHGDIYIEDIFEPKDSETIKNNIVPENTVLCFFTLLGNIGAAINLQTIFNDINFETVERIIESLQNLNNIQNSYTEKTQYLNTINTQLLYNNCFKNATFYYPMQKYIDVFLTQMNFESFNYKKTFYNSNKESCKLEKVDDKTKGGLSTSQYINKKNATRLENTISIYFFICCRPFNTEDNRIRELFKYETYIRYINTELVKKNNTPPDLRAKDTLLCTSYNKNKDSFMINKIRGYIINTNKYHDYKYHQYGDRMMEIYNEFIIGNFRNILFFSYLSINKQFFILNKIISFNNIPIIKLVFNYIIQNSVTEKFHNILLSNGFTSIIKKNNKLKDNKKYTNIALDYEVEINHLYYIYSKEIKNYLDLFWKIDHLLEKENKDKLNTIISTFQTNIIQDNYLIYHNVSFIYKNIFNNITEILITNKTTIYELIKFKIYLTGCERIKIKTVVFYKIVNNYIRTIIKQIIDIINKFKIKIYFYSSCLEELILNNIEYVSFTDINIDTITIRANKDCDCDIFFDKITINKLTIKGVDSKNMSLQILKGCRINGNIDISSFNKLSLSIERTDFINGPSINITNCVNIDSLIMVNIIKQPIIVLESSVLNKFILTNIKWISYPIKCIKLIIMNYKIKQFTSTYIKYTTVVFENNRQGFKYTLQPNNRGLNKQPSREKTPDVLDDFNLDDFNLDDFNFLEGDL